MNLALAMSIINRDAKVACRSAVWHATVAVAEAGVMRVSSSLRSPSLLIHEKAVFCVAKTASQMQCYHVILYIF